MKTSHFITKLIATVALLLPAFALLATETNTVSDLAGKWHGTNHFNGISYEEATQKKVAAQDIEIVLHISADGKVTGLVGEAKLSGSVMEAHRGWFGKLLRMKTNFIIEGQIVGAVVPGSESGSHEIKVPFTFEDARISGSIYVIYPIKGPYPFLGIRLTR